MCCDVSHEKKIRWRKDDQIGRSKMNAKVATHVYIGECLNLFSRFGERLVVPAWCPASLIQPPVSAQHAAVTDLASRPSNYK